MVTCYTSFTSCCKNELVILKELIWALKLVDIKKIISIIHKTGNTRMNVLLVIVTRNVMTISHPVMNAHSTFPTTIRYYDNCSWEDYIIIK